jgi:hypothetical protein
MYISLIETDELTVQIDENLSGHERLLFFTFVWGTPIPSTETVKFTIQGQSLPSGGADPILTNGDLIIMMNSSF